MSEKKRFILHVDMDHFYTAVEEREHPEYKGKPVVVGADPKGGKGRGVVSTSNYEARNSGIRSGMPISRAWHLCPQAIYLPPNFPLYIKISNEIMQITRKYADKFEQWGIDEAFLDVSERVNDYNGSIEMAKQLKREIRDKENLTCSIGIGPNKLIAKMASDHRKPDGLTIVQEHEAKAFLAPLPVRKLLWVGRKTEAKLRDMGINTIGDLARFDPAVLASAFGVMGTQMHLSARGVDRSEVETRTDVKSISHENTFEEDIDDTEAMLKALVTLSQGVIKEVMKQKVFFKTVTVKMRYENFETHTRSKTLAHITNRPEDLQKATRELFMAYLKDGRKIRLIGVRVSNFIKGEKQKKLL
jgi:DNA polymerase IV (DinB-like DNA polymerase)